MSNHFTKAETLLIEGFDCAEGHEVMHALYHLDHNNLKILREMIDTIFIEREQEQKGKH
jgi:hypothetical protein